MSDLALDRQLWRFEYGTLGPEALEDALREVTRELTSERVELFRERSRIELWNRDILRAHTDAYGGAVRAVDRHEFRNALRLIHRCRALRTCVLELLKAARDIDEASATASEVHEAAGATQLRALPAVASLADTLEATRKLMRDARYRDASQLARSGLRLGLPLLEVRPPTDEERAELRSRFAALESVNVETRFFAEDGDGTGAAIRALETLLEKNHVALASRLCTELEIGLAARRRFRDFFERARQAGAAAILTDDELKTSVRDRSWDGAIDYYWHRSIAKFEKVLTGSRRRLERIVSEIEASLHELDSTD